MKFEITIPEKLNDLTLKQYQKFADVLSIEDAEQDFINRKALEIFYGIDAKYYNDLKVSDIDKLIEAVNKVLAVESVFENTVTIDGVEFGFVPNLDDITFGELVDYDSRVEVKDWHKLMGVMFRPITKKQGNKYIIEKYDPGRALPSIPLGVALGAVGFFFDLGKDLLTDTLNSLTGDQQAAIEKQTLEESGVGILQSIRLPMEMLKDSMLLQIPTYTNA